mgnify:CR=1 FL=1
MELTWSWTATVHRAMHREWYIFGCGGNGEGGQEEMEEMARDSKMEENMRQLLTVSTMRNSLLFLRHHVLSL